MKKIKVYLYLPLFIIILIMKNDKTLAQNLVPNPSFETVTDCLNLEFAAGTIPPWDQPTGGSSDAFNTCAGWSSYGVPANNFGYQ